MADCQAHAEAFPVGREKRLEELALQIRECPALGPPLLAILILFEREPQSLK
jgi:hypothetical protein